MASNNIVDYNGGSTEIAMSQCLTCNGIFPTEALTKVGGCPFCVGKTDKGQELNKFSARLQEFIMHRSDGEEIVKFLEKTIQDKWGWKMNC